MEAQYKVVHWFQIPTFRVPRWLWVVGLVAVAIGIGLFAMLGGSSNPVPQQPVALAAPSTGSTGSPQASSGQAAPVASADKPVVPVAAAQPSQAAEPAVPAGVLKFQSGLELYEAAMAGRVQAWKQNQSGSIIQVRGVLSNIIGPGNLVLHYIPPLKTEYHGNVDVALEVAGVRLPCSPPANTLHNVTRLKSGDQITVQAEIGWVERRGPYAAAVSLINCTIISR